MRSRVPVAKLSSPATIRQPGGSAESRAANLGDVTLIKAAGQGETRHVMGPSWQKPSSPSRGQRLLIFTVVVLAVVVVAVALLLLMYTAVLGPATTG